MSSPDVQRLQRLSEEGDEAATRALLDELVRRNDASGLRRALPSFEPTREGWAALCEHLSAEHPKLLTSAAIETLDAALEGWPEALRFCPEPWRDDALAGERLKLVRSVSGEALGLGRERSGREGPVLPRAAALLDALARLTRVDAFPGEHLELLTEHPERLPRLTHLDVEGVPWARRGIGGLLRWSGERPIEHLGLRPIYAVAPWTEHDRSSDNLRALAGFAHPSLRSIALEPVLPSVEHASALWSALFEGPLFTRVESLSVPGSMWLLQTCLEHPGFPRETLRHLSLRGVTRDTAQWLMRHPHTIARLEHITLEVPRPSGEVVVIWRELRRALEAMGIEADMGPFLDLTTSPGYEALLVGAGEGEAEATRELQRALDRVRPARARSGPRRWQDNAFSDHRRERLPDAAALADVNACVGSLSAARSLAVASRCFSERTPEALASPSTNPALWALCTQVLDETWSLDDVERLDAALRHWPEAWKVLPESWVREAFVEGRCSPRLGLGRVLDLSPLDDPATLRHRAVCACEPQRGRVHAFQHLAACESLGPVTRLLGFPAHLRPMRGSPRPLDSLLQSERFRRLRHFSARGVPGDALDGLFAWLDARPLERLELTVAASSAYPVEGLFRFRGRALQELVLDVEGVSGRSWLELIGSWLRAPALGGAPSLGLPRALDAAKVRGLLRGSALRGRERLRLRVDEEGAALLERAGVAWEPWDGGG